MTSLVLIREGFQVEVQIEEDFDQALDKFMPINPPTSAIESRGLNVWSTAEGRIAVDPRTIVRIVE